MAIGITLAALFLTPLLHYLPIAMLAATIIVAVLPLLNFSTFLRAWKFSWSDFLQPQQWLITLILGVQVGVANGTVVSILLYLYNTSKPHIAEISLLDGT